MQPRLSINICAFNAAQRLPALIAQARECSAEVLIGVDAGCTDDTWAVASRLADVAYRFAHTGSAVPARMLAFRFARTPWIFSLDDDEWLEPGMPAVLAELTSRDDYTHAFFPRKCLIGTDPLRYVREPPWFPDWQLRLFRNDLSLVTRPMRVHAGYCAMGAGVFEPRASILHLDRLLRSDDERAKKIEYYAKFGDPSDGDVLYPSLTGRVSDTAAVLAARPERPRLTSIRHDGICPARPWDTKPGWRADVRVDMPRTRSGQTPLFAQVEAQNTGTLSWQRNPERWPILNLGYHLRNGDGRMAQFDAQRFAVSGRVAPGQVARWICEIVPLARGDHVLEWDLVSEGECWFAECGSPTTTLLLRVT